MRTYLLGCLLLLLCSCNKPLDAYLPKSATSTTPLNDGFTHYQIKKSSHSATTNAYKSVETAELRFVVRFDSTAIYQTVDPTNQYDINKLYGFSDNNAMHHQYSARFGWAWVDNALRLYAYVYNDGVRSEKEIGRIPIGSRISCGIKVTPTHYIFSMNDVVETMPRTSTTPLAKGYQLYPYFGGDETAPHDVNIYIKGE